MPQGVQPIFVDEHTDVINLGEVDHGCQGGGASDAVIPRRGEVGQGRREQNSPCRSRSSAPRSESSSGFLVPNASDT